MIQIHYTEVRSPETKFQAWFQVIGDFVLLIFLEAIYAGIFATGFNITISGVVSGVVDENFFGGLIIMTIGIIATTFWPLLCWFFIKNNLSLAWNFKK
ncbi:hypothetical protein KKH35_01160 [Patescibacteria group bacterium]|nr:hypothetical protein [Patescibacteria group bacterium]